MRLSDSRILTTHTGSLPRPPRLSELLIQEGEGIDVDTAEKAREIVSAVAACVREQAAAGVDVANDGEQPRVGFQLYVPQRMAGFGGASKRPPVPDFEKFPLYAEMVRGRGLRRAKIDSAPEAIAPVAYSDLSHAVAEADAFDAALAAEGTAFAETFMSAASPGIIAATMLNRHYDSHDAYLAALADEMRTEYAFIVDRGYLLQLDCPDLAMERNRLFRGMSITEFRDAIEGHIAAINRALEGIPADRVRLHCCWGNWDGPHVDDVDLADILDILYQANVGALSLPLANPRHSHEVDVIAANPPPGDMVLIAGVIDPTTNFVEHPEVVAKRIADAVRAVGDRERVQAGTDCGFGTFAGSEMVAADVVWAKFRALAEGACLASARLWNN